LVHGKEGTREVKEREVVGCFALPADEQATQEGGNDRIGRRCMTDSRLRVARPWADAARRDAARHNGNRPCLYTRVDAERGVGTSEGGRA
jgi:hypothetical protein